LEAIAKCGYLAWISLERKIVKAMVLAAGLGSRLGVLTRGVPKCLIEVGGKTMIAHVLERLKLHGVTDVVVNLHYLGDLVKEYLINNSSFGLHIIFSEEEDLLGTGGGLKKVQQFFDGEQAFILHNSDVFSDINLTDLLAFHKKNNPLVSLAVMQRETERYLLFDSKFNLSGWENVKEATGETFGAEQTHTQLAFSGIQVINPRIFEYMKNESGAFSTMRIFMKAAKLGEQILAYRMDGNYWIDMGTPEKLKELQALLEGKPSHH
jgi:MurNAc alpha-1-phosphate uridylyltransferase